MKQLHHTIIRLLSTIALLSLMAVTVDAADSKFRRTVEHYSIPEVVLVNQNGEKVPLKGFLLSGKPVVVEFMYSSCTSICPILSAGFFNLQQKLGADSKNISLVSISIDPENDTPKIMKEYLKKYRAKPGWDFLTGSRADIDKVLQAFNAYIPNKMSHFPLTLIKYPSSDRWVRIYGLMSSSEFMTEFTKAASP